MKPRLSPILLSVLALLTGCSLFKPTLKFELAGTPDMNSGLPFHVLVRNVTADQFRSESYADVARLAVAANPTVLRSAVIYTPGDKEYHSTISLPPPKEGSVGLYCLFTNPVGTWRVLLERPLPKVFKVTLGQTGLRTDGPP